MPPERVPRIALLPTDPGIHPSRGHGRRGPRRPGRRKTARSPARATPANAAPHADAALACDLAARLAAGHYELPVADVAAATRRSRVASRARHVAIYIAHVTLGTPLDAVAVQFRRDRTTASYACHAIEDARDDPAFDAALASLELTARVLRELGRAETNA